MPVNAVIYARFSSHQQREESIEGQLRVCREYAARNKMRIVGTYEDRAISGTSDRRPSFLRMISDAAKGTFSVVLVYKGDRFARNRYDKAIYRNKLKKHGVTIVSATETIPEGAEGIILESVLDGMAEYFSVNLAQNTLRGMKENALKARHNGTRVPFGYSLDADKQYIKDPERAPYVPQIFQQYLEGVSQKNIFSWLKQHNIKHFGNDLNYGTLRRILTNEKYIGIYRFADIEIADACPVLVSEEVFFMVQDKLEKGRYSRESKSTAVNFLLTGKTVCGECQSTVSGDSGTSKGGKTYYYYSCQGKKTKNGCRLKNYPKADLESFVVRAVLNILQQDDVIETIADAVMRYQDDDPNARILEACQKQVRDIERQIENLVLAISSGVKSESVRRKVDELEQELKTAKREVVMAKAESGFVTRDQVVYWMTKFAEGDIEDESFRETLIDALINSVIIHNGCIKLVLNYTDEKRRKVTYVEDADLSPISPVFDRDCSGVPDRNRTRISSSGNCCLIH
jgi:site-specific DNA recombinase